MSDTGAAAMRGVTFGAPDGSLWAAVLDRPGAAGGPALVARAGDEGEGRAEGLSWGEAGGGAWTLAGDGVDLTIVPASVPPGEEGAPPWPGAADRGLPELCHVSGTLAVGGAQRPVQCVGTRIAATDPAAGRAASARLMGAWFSDAEAIALLALRGGGAHHDRDAAAAALFDAEGWLAVNDPRLSTTYDDAGHPTRANLELWVGEGEDEFPRRAAGEAAGPGSTVSGDGIALEVVPLHCHSRGQEGFGVYVVASF